MATAFSLALFYELFWLDLFPAGTYMPPNALFPMLCVFTLMETLPYPDIITLFLPVILTLPLAFLGACVENRQREWQVVGYNHVILALRSGGAMGRAAGRSVYFSLAQLFFMNFCVFFIATAAVLFALKGLQLWQGQPLSFTHASWPLLWVIGCVGGLLGLRIRRNYLVFGCGSICIALGLAAYSWA
jgi:hypothetical protein